MRFSSFIKQTLVIASLSFAVAAFADGSFTIHPVYKVGDTATYQIHGEFDAGGQTVTMDAKAEGTIKQVNADGSVEIVRQLMNGSIDFGGQTMPIPATPPQTYDMAADGTLIKIEGDSVSSQAYRAQNLNSLPLPTKPVKIGDTWSRDFAADPHGSVAAHGDYKVIGEDTVGGQKTLEIQGTVSEKGDAGGSTNWTVWLSESNWQMVKSTATLTNFPEPGSPMPVNGTLTLTLVTS